MSDTCMICGMTEPVHVSEVGRYPLYKCRGCGLEFLRPQPDGVNLARIYQDYYRSWNIAGSLAEVSSMKQRTFGGYLRRAAMYVSSGRLLDVGCATGDLMTVARDMGFDVFGVEIAPQGVAMCQARFGADRISPKPLEKGDFPVNYFDIITLSDLLEHIPEPRSFLETVTHLLKPGGVLMVVTPDTSTWIRSVSGAAWPHYKEEHLWYFNRSNIRKFLSTCLTPLAVARADKSLTINYVRSVLMAYRGRHTTVSRLVRLAGIVPRRIAGHPFKVSCGEMFVLARKEGK
ncbi:MAG: class I SAM-dependent methyltransferase [Pelobacteraceae bacterium]